MKRVEKSHDNEVIKEIIERKQPSTGEELVAIVTEELKMSRDEAIDVLLKLEDQEEIFFTKLPVGYPASLVEYLLTPWAYWYWVVIGTSIVAVASVLTAPSGLSFLTYIRYLSTPFFLMFIPGLCVTRILYLGEDIGNLKLVVMSIGISVSLTSVIGLLLNYTPWGISTKALTFTVFLLVLALASVAMIREHINR